MIPEKQLKRRVALYQMTESAFGWYAIFDVPHDEEGNERAMENWARVSHPIDVELQPRARDEIIADAIRGLDAEERRLREELGEKLRAIAERRATLLALPAPEVAS